MNDRNAGRKKHFSDNEIAVIKGRHSAGESVTALALDYHVSRQTMSLYINGHNNTDTVLRLLSYREWIRKNASFANIDSAENCNLRIEFMHKDELCSEILVNEHTKKVYVKNHCVNIVHRAFGVVDYPEWDDYEFFLKSRCIPADRFMVKNYLNVHNIPGYDCLAIIEETEGRMAEDCQWIRMYRLKEGTYASNNGNNKT